MEESLFTRHFNSELDQLSGVPYKVQVRKKRIINQLTREEKATINELAEMQNISVPTATELLNELITEGLVVDTGEKSIGVGRKAAIYALAPAFGYFLGVEIKKYKLNLGLMAFNKEMIHSELNIPFPYEESDQALKAIVGHIQRFLKSIDIPQAKVMATGVSISGRINVRSGKILTFHHFGDAPIKEKLEEILKMPVLLDNDSRTIAYGEYHMGLAKESSNTLVVNLDYGIALGIFVDGKPVYGVSGYAGELGHIPIFNNEKICYCGKKGCLETEASGFALLDYLKTSMAGGKSSVLSKVLEEKKMIELEDVVEAVNHGDNLAIEALSSIAEKLGRGLAVTINIFNPDVIILTGLLSRMGDGLLLPVKSSIFQHSLSVVNTDTKVVNSRFHETAGLPGTCLLVRAKYLGLV